MVSSSPINKVRGLGLACNTRPVIRLVGASGDYLSRVFISQFRSNLDGCHVWAAGSPCPFVLWRQAIPKHRQTHKANERRHKANEQRHQSLDHKVVKLI